MAAGDGVRLIEEAVTDFARQVGAKAVKVCLEGLVLLRAC